MVAIVGDDLPHDPPQLQAATAFPDVYALRGAWPRGDAYWQALEDNAKDARLAIVWRGNEHNEYFFFQSNQPFDLYSTDVNQIMSTFRIVPQRMIRQKFKPHLDELAALLARLQAQSPEKLAVVGTPPPKSDDEALRSLFATEPHFVLWANYLGKTLEEVKITPPKIRLKLWYILQTMLRDAAEAGGARFIAVPAEAQDEDGFLKPEFWHQDVTHGNVAYGQIMAERIVKELR